ncbi:MAG: biliverdin-producing heme oxygenase, partial [Cyanobacteria bacterium J06635_11]
MCAPSVMCPPFAICLREGTQQAHTLTENTAFMKCFLKGMVTREPFRQLMANLYFIYSALEDEMLNYADHPVVGAVHFPRLERTMALEKDLEFYFGAHWRSEIKPSGKTICYVMRIHAIANDNPALLAAHAYVRYMGDLSGGQGLRAITRSVLGLPEGQGTAFYEFKGLSTAATRRTFKARYRDVLNSLPLDLELAKALIEEANLAFKLNRSVLKALEPLVIAEIGKERFELVTREAT